MGSQGIKRRGFVAALLAAPFAAFARKPAVVPEGYILVEPTMISRLFMQGVAAAPALTEDIGEARILEEFFADNFLCYEGPPRAWTHCMFTGKRSTYRLFAVVTEGISIEDRMNLVGAITRGFTHAKNLASIEMPKPPLYWRKHVEFSAHEQRRFDEEIHTSGAEYTIKNRGPVDKMFTMLRFRLSIPAIDKILDKLDTFHKEGDLVKNLNEVMI